MILTPLSSSIAQYTEGLSISDASLGILLYGRNGSLARYLKVDDDHRAAVNPIIQIASEVGFPALVSVTTGGTGVTVLSANPLRKPGSYIQNISDTDMEFAYNTSLTVGQNGTLSAGGGVLRLSENNCIYTGAIRLYQNSGTSKNVYVASFV